MQFGDLPKHLRTHLAAPDPIEISHTIKYSLSLSLTYSHSQSLSLIILLIKF